MAAAFSLTPDNQRRLLVLRVTALAATLALSVLARPLFHILPPVFILLCVCLLWSGFAAYAVARMRRAIGEIELFGQVCADIVLLSAWLAFCGGTANPLTALYLLPVSAAAALLRPRLAWAAAGVAILAYSLLWVIAVPITVEDVDQAMRMHIAGMWLGFSLSAALLASIVARMGSDLRERERHLAAARERSLRDERIVALGNLAAGAAHALGTPLNTIALLAGEIAEGTSPDGRLADDARELRQQVERCREIIDGLLNQADVARAEQERQPLEQWLRQRLRNFAQLRPEAVARLEIEGAIAHVATEGDIALAQAIANLLDNAADAGSRDIVLSVTRDNGTSGNIAITVRDDGAGFSPQALQHAGRIPYSDKARGMGLGLYLANATVERIGGRLECRNLMRGAEVRMLLPTTALLDVK